MSEKAKRIKIRVRKGLFRIWLPGLSFRFMRRMLKFGLKFTIATKAKPASSDNPNGSALDVQERWNEMTVPELMDLLNQLLDELANYEPFVLVEVQDKAEDVYVKIETI